MKKNKKKTKKRLNVKKLIIFILLFYLIIYGIYSLYQVPIKNIIIKGNYYLKDSLIIREADIKDYPPIISVRKSKIINNLKRLDLVEDVKVKKTKNLELIIEIKEKKIICEYDGKYILSDNTKIEGNYLGVPTLINYTPEDTLKKFLNNMKDLNYDIINSISEIEYAPSKDSDGKIIDEEIFHFKMNDGNLVIISIDRIGIMSKYQKIYASLKDKKGILHLDKGNYLEVK